ncbi:MAG TPA: SDR family NAD(P)-dependent oxidoreductase [Bacteroidetes bacterium]|nr:SDR family NAD(P)-dependent oxidoreductase [Bacteroidota bacterium]
MGTSRTPEKAEIKDYPLIALDITSDESVKNAFEQIKEKLDTIDVLINFAGFSVCGALIDTTVEEMQKQFEVNLFGFHRVVRTVVPIMQKQEKGGLIIHTGSIGGRLAIPYQSLYSASKAALALYTDALRMELNDTNVKFTLIEPGDTATDFHAGRHFVQGFENDPKAQRAIEIMHESESKGDDPIIVAKKIYKIMKTKKPKPRYTVGSQAFWVGIGLRLLPFSMIEKATLGEYSKKKKK